MKDLEYKTLVFDCDGVILNSNKIKTEAFHEICSRFGKAAADKIVEYHVNNGGISRYEKFKWLLQELFGRVDLNILNDLLLDYGSEVRSQLLTCEMASGLHLLRENSSASWAVVSGGDQEELRWVFKERNISHFFDAGIFGSPDQKDTILLREISSKNFKMPSLFIGDSRYDHIVSTNAGLDFVFLSDWTEFNGWEKYSSENNINFYKNLNDLRMSVQ